MRVFWCKMHQNRFHFWPGLRSRPARGSTTFPHTSLCTGKGDSPFSLNAFGVSMSRSGFFKYDHLCLCLVSPSVPYSMSSKYQFVTNRGSRDDAGVPLAAAVASCISRCAALAAEFRNEVDLFTGD